MHEQHVFATPKQNQVERTKRKKAQPSRPPPRNREWNETTGQFLLNS